MCDYGADLFPTTFHPPHGFLGDRLLNWQIFFHQVQKLSVSQRLHGKGYWAFKFHMVQLNFIGIIQLN